MTKMTPGENQIMVTMLKSTKPMQTRWRRGGKNTQETIEAMAQAAEEVSQVRREVEDDLSESRIEGGQSVNPPDKFEVAAKSGLEGENFALSEDFLPDEEAAEEEKEIFADAPSQEPVEAGFGLDSEDGGPGSDVRVIPESDEDFFSQTSNQSAAQSQTSTHSAVQGLAAASCCSPIPELSENEPVEWVETEVLGNSQKSDEENNLVDTSKGRFAFSKLSSSA